jgi:hypothetical protein
MALDQFGWKEKEWGTALPVAGNLANMFPFPW